MPTNVAKYNLPAPPRSPQVEVVRKLLAEDPVPTPLGTYLARALVARFFRTQAMLLRESLGISADGSDKAFAQE